MSKWVFSMCMGVVASGFASAAESPSLPTPASSAPIVVKAAPIALVWDADSKSADLTKGGTNVVFSFSVTNVSKEPVTITKVQPSCGCTLVKMPANPWVLAPGAHDTLKLDVDVRGKHGTLVKNAMVTSTAGFKVLQIQVTLPPQPNLPAAMNNFESRIQNIHKAMADRQAIFKGDCASCHAVPAKDKSGQALYYAVCAICHESAHRASMVTDLANMNRPFSREDWTKAVAEGKPGTMMAAFSRKEDHGPLDDAQIKSLVDYLLVRFPNKPASAYANQATNKAPALPALPRPVLK